MNKKYIRDILYDIRNIYIGDEEESRLIEDDEVINERIESYRLYGVNEKDLKRIKKILIYNKKNYSKGKSEWKELSKILCSYIDVEELCNDMMDMIWLVENEGIEREIIEDEGLEDYFIFD